MSIYSELQKLYPSFKIPTEKFTNYYLYQLLEAGICEQKHLDQMANLFDKEKDISKYKMKSMDKILKYFEEQDWKLSEIDMTPYLSDYQEKEFNDYKEHNFYISLDLKQANWQAFQTAFSLKLPEFSNWVKNEFKIHPFIAESKSWRQLLFGNTNPKKIQIISKFLMQKIYLNLPLQLSEKCVGKRSDELIFEFTSRPSAEIISSLSKLSIQLDLQTSLNLFQMKNEFSFSENVKIKYSLSLVDEEIILNKKMCGVSGNRYFIHLKNLILNTTIKDEDLYFENQGYLAKWVL